jgi:putative MFS transporter
MIDPRVIDQKRWSKFLTVATVAVALGSFTDLYDLAGVAGSGAASLIPAMHLTTMQFGLVATIAYIGRPIGAILFGPISDRVGRRRAFTWTLMLFVVFEGLAALSQEFWQLLVCRVIIGFGVGADYVPATTMLSEYTPARSRGRYLILATMLCGGLGMAGAFIFAYLLFPLGPWMWRVLYGIGVIPAAIGLIVRIGLPEPPRWNVGKGRVDVARASMEQIGLDPNDVSIYQADASLVVKSQWSAFRPYVFWFTIPFALYSVLSGSGATGFSLVGPIIFAAIGVAGRDALLYQALAFFVPQLVGASTAAMVTDRFGRWQCMTVGMGLCTAAYMGLIFFASSQTLPVMMSLLAMAGFGSYFNMGFPFAVPSEVYPVTIRGKGTGINQCVFATMGLVGGLPAAFLLAAGYSVGWIFATYAGFMMVSIVLIAAIRARLNIARRSLEDITKSWARPTT